MAECEKCIYNGQIFNACYRCKHNKETKTEDNFELIYYPPPKGHHYSGDDDFPVY